jgi:dTDP-4-amino-4,6-dideoxygalactose transaminase
MSNYWLTTILLDERLTGISNDRLRVVLFKSGIETRFLWKPLHLQPVYKSAPYYGGNLAEKLFLSGLCLPSSVNLNFEDQKLVVRLIEKELRKIY